jgi:hypothetical protein
LFIEVNCCFYLEGRTLLSSQEILKFLPTIQTLREICNCFRLIIEKHSEKTVNILPNIFLSRVDFVVVVVVVVIIIIIIAAVAVVVVVVEKG